MSVLGYEKNDKCLKITTMNSEQTLKRRWRMRYVKPKYFSKILPSPNLSKCIVIHILFFLLCHRSTRIVEGKPEMPGTETDVDDKLFSEKLSPEFRSIDPDQYYYDEDDDPYGFLSEDAYENNDDNEYTGGDEYENYDDSAGNVDKAGK